MSSIECATCGLAPCDLPDGIDPELIFDTEDGETRCHACVGWDDDYDDEPEPCGRPVDDVPTGGLL